MPCSCRYILRYTVIEKKNRQTLSHVQRDVQASVSRNMLERLEHEEDKENVSGFGCVCVRLCV